MMKHLIRTQFKPIPIVTAFLLLLLVIVLPTAAQEPSCPPFPPPCPADATCPAPPNCVPVEPTRPGMFTNPEWLRIDHHQVTVSIKDQIATTSVDMEFYNQGNAL